MGDPGEPVWTLCASAASTEFAQIKDLQHLQPGEQLPSEPPAAQGHPEGEAGGGLPAGSVLGPHDVWP